MTPTRQRRLPSPSWRTKPRVFTWMRDEPDPIVVWVNSLEAKEARLSSYPDAFFTTGHYDGHPVVLVRMNAADAAGPARAVLLSDPGLAIANRPLPPPAAGRSSRDFRPNVGGRRHTDGHG